MITGDASPKKLNTSLHNSPVKEACVYAAPHALLMVQPLHAWLVIVCCRFGYDAFSLKEATMGDVLQQVGYITAHYGKW
jgi:hypothetical protein